MRILVAAIAFAITVSGLFLFENYKNTPLEEDYAQIVQGLVNQNQSKAPTPQPSPKATVGIAKPTNKSSKIPNKTLAPSEIPSFTAIPTATLPLASLTPVINNQQAISTPTLTPTIAPSFIPTSPPIPTPNPSEQSNQIIIISLDSPIEQNSTAKLDMKTAPGTQCGIKVTLPSGSQSTAKGLEAKIADNSGIISWSWKINWNTTPGTANIDITCSKDGQSFSKSLQMAIIKR